jgi:hypothetical protein
VSVRRGRGVKERRISKYFNYESAFSDLPGKSPI